MFMQFIGSVLCAANDELQNACVFAFNGWVNRAALDHYGSSFSCFIKKVSLSSVDFPTFPK